MVRKNRFGMILSDYEMEALKRLAEYEGGLPMAAMVRRLICLSAKEKGLWPGRPVPKRDTQGSGDVSRV